MRTGNTLLITAALSLLSGSALATNGYFTHGLGVKNKAMAGAGTADPAEAMAIANNPASAVLLGKSLQVGMSVFSPRREYTASPSQANGNGGAFTLGAGTVTSDSNYFPIPYAAWTRPLDEESALGIAVYGRGGMNTDYRSGNASFDPDGPGPAPVMTLPGTFGAGDTGVNLNQLFAELAYARRNGNFSWGITGMFVAQAFDANGVASFAPYSYDFAASGGTQMPTTLTNNGHDYSTGFGLKAGVHWQASQRLKLALSYQAKIRMSEFDDYNNLFAGRGSFDIPTNIRFGLSYLFSDRLTLNYDIDHTDYREVDSVGNTISRLFNCPTAGQGGTDLSYCLGGSNAAGFGWNDVTVHKFGLSYRPSAQSPWTFRAGVSQGENPIEATEVLFNILAPGVIERHFTVGLSRKLNSGREWTAGFMYAPSAGSSGANTFDPTQFIDLKMHQYEFEFGFSW